MPINLVHLKSVAEILFSLHFVFLFVGGAIVSLYATNPALAAKVRTTEDVDVIIEIASYSRFTSLEERLRSVGFFNDNESGVYASIKSRDLLM